MAPSATTVTLFTLLGAYAGLWCVSGPLLDWVGGSLPAPLTRAVRVRLVGLRRSVGWLAAVLLLSELRAASLPA